MVLADAQPGPLQCSLFSACGHYLVGLVLAEGGGSPVGEEVGNLTFLSGMKTHPCDLGKAFDSLWTARAKMAMELRGCADPVEKFAGKAILPY